MPVLLMQEVGLYKCSVTCESDQADSLVMSVEVKPGMSGVLYQLDYQYCLYALFPVYP